MHQSPITILTTNPITLPTTNHNTDKNITTFAWISNCHLTLKMTSAHDVETPVTSNCPFQDSFHPDGQIPSRYIIHSVNKKKNVQIYLYNKLNSTRVSIGRYLWSIGEQIYKWCHC